MKKFKVSEMRVIKKNEVDNEDAGGVLNFRVERVDVESCSALNVATFVVAKKICT